MLRRITEWSLAILLAALFLMVGVAKFVSPGWTVRFGAWGYPSWVVAVVGTIEVVGAILLIVPRVRVPAALLLVAVMMGAGITHAIHGELPRVLVNVAIAGLLMLVAHLRGWRVAGRAS
jgi:putative oxidoreductase